MFECHSVAAIASARASISSVGAAVDTVLLAEQIRSLHELGSVLAAAEATVTAAFVARRRAEQVAAGMPARRVGQGIPQEIGLARRESPARAGRYAGFATVLTRELPHTFAALQAGQTSEWRAMLVTRETGWLSAVDRASVDADLGPRLGSMGDRQVEAEAARLAYTAHPRGKIRAIERAAGGRHVSLRPAPDGQCRLNATLPLAQGVAAYAALCKAADAARAGGDERGRGQVMADTLVERVTGQAHAEGLPISVNLIMTDTALFNGGAEPATVSGYGPVPAPFARDLIHQASAEADVKVRIRRLLTDAAGRLITMETGSRDFTPAMSAFVKLRDQWCTTPYCGAAIRHIDHLIPVVEGGPTSLANATGLCEACNYAKQAPGWTVTPQPDGIAHLSTPTGHHQTSFAGDKSPRDAPPTARTPTTIIRRRSKRARAPASTAP